MVRPLRSGEGKQSPSTWSWCLRFGKVQPDENCSLRRHMDLAGERTIAGPAEDAGYEGREGRPVHPIPTCQRLHCRMWGRALPEIRDQDLAVATACRLLCRIGELYAPNMEAAEQSAYLGNIVQ